MAPGLSSPLSAYSRSASRSLLGALTNFPSLAFSEYSHLFIHTDHAGWALDEEANCLLAKASHLGYPASQFFPLCQHLRQCIHFTSQFAILSPKFMRSKATFSFDYFHGKPGTGKEFDAVYKFVEENKDRFNMIRCTHREMYDVIRSAGFPEERIIQIVIPVDTNIFFRLEDHFRIKVRESLGIPPGSYVIGSFQKDGEGWNEGNKPKLIKGPDIFIDTLKHLIKSLPNLFVLLTGPARGFVKQNLRAAGIPFTHQLLRSYSDLNKLFNCLDLYLITSRQEGGPKSLLEAMACNVPVISTPVGQATEIIVDGKNGFLSDCDPEAIYSKVQELLRVKADGNLVNILARAQSDAQKYSWRGMNNSWNLFFQKIFAR